MKNIKKVLIALFMIGTFLLAGCNGIEGNQSIASSNGNIQIPENGIVSAETFKKIKDSGEMGLLDGNNSDFSYEWMFLADDIKTPKDLNLKVNSVKDNIDKVKNQSKSDIVYGFSFAETSALDTKTALSITFNKKLKCSASDIYQLEGDKLIKKDTATVDFSKSGKQTTTINFSTQYRKGVFYIVCSDPKQDAIDQDSNGSSSDASNGESENSENSTSGESSNGEESSNSGIDESNLSEKEKQSLKVKKQLGINTDKGEPNKNGKDKYLTDPTPAGKPKPFEWNESGNKVDKSKVAGYVTLSIDCKTLLKPANRKVAIKNGKGDMIPKNGIIYKTRKVKFYKNETVFDVLLREVKKYKIHMEFSMTPIYNSNYIEGIHNLYEFDGGELSGWMYKVNGWYPNYGCSRYKLKNGDKINWRYTCDLGKDVGCDWMTNKK